VYGASYGQHFVEIPSTPHYVNDVLNAAQSGATTLDFDDEVEYPIEYFFTKITITWLFNTLKAHPNISIDDYKIINILIGANDVCSQCWDWDRPTPEQAAETYAYNIEMTIEKIYELLPNTLINITPLFVSGSF
jgi:hypothetical protein